MTSSRLPLFGRVTVLAAAIVTLSGCSSSAGTATPAPQPSTLQQALAVVPSSVTAVEITDQAAAKKRWGLADLTGSAWSDKAQAEKLKEFMQHSQKSAAGVELQTYSAMMDDWGWNGMDVDWEVRYTQKGAAPVTVSRLRDGLDMATVTKSFADHTFKQSGTADEVRFDSDLTNPDARAFLRGVTVIPSKHLVISAHPEAAKLPSAESSLAGNETVRQLTSDPGPVDYLALSIGPGACVDPGANFAAKVPAPSPEQIKELTKEFAGLGAIGGAAAAAVDDEHVRVRTSYADDAAATKDLPARQKLLIDGKSLASQQPYSSLFPGTVKADGKFLVYELTPSPTARVMQAYQQRDTPWALCT